MSGYVVVCVYVNENAEHNIWKEDDAGDSYRQLSGFSAPELKEGCEVRLENHHVSSIAFQINLRLLTWDIS